MMELAKKALIDGKSQLKRIRFKTSIQGKLLFTIVPLVILIMVFTGFISARMIAHQIRKGFEERIGDAIDASIVYFEDYQNQVIDAATVIGKMSNLRDSLLSGDKKTMAQVLSTITGDMPLVDDIYVFNDSGQLKGTGLNMNFKNHNASEDILFKAGMIGARQGNVIYRDGDVLVRGAGPIQEYIGSSNKVGVAIAVTKLDNRFIERLKEMTGLEFILYTPGASYTTIKLEKLNDKLEKGAIENLTDDQFNHFFSDDWEEQKTKIIEKKIGGLGYLVITVPMISTRGEKVAVLSAAISTAELDMALDNNFKTMAVITIVASLAVIILSFIVSSGIVKPLKLLMKDTRELSNGNLTVRAKIKSSDEIGQLAEEFNTMGTFMLKAVNEIRSNVMHVNQSSKVLKQSSDEIYDFAHKNFEDARRIAEGAETQTRLITDVSDKIGEVNNAASDVTEQSLNIKDYTDNAINKLMDGHNRVNRLGEQLNKTGDIIHNISTFLNEHNESMKRINNIMEFIEHIAHQSKLLALNTAIEAARLGGQAQGFHTISLEIKNLSDESNRSVKEIRSIIENLNKNQEIINNMVNDGVDAIETSSSIMGKTLEEFNNITESVLSIGKMTKEISRKAELQEKELGEILSMAQQIVAISDENATRANDAAENASKQVKIIEGNRMEIQRLNNMVKTGTALIDRFRLEA